MGPAAYTKPMKKIRGFSYVFTSLKTAQTQQTDEGKLRLYVISALKNQPVEDATVTISYSGEPDSVIEEVKTDASGMIPEITLPRTPLEYSMAPRIPALCGIYLPHFQRRI